MHCIWNLDVRDMTFALLLLSELLVDNQCMCRSWQVDFELPLGSTASRSRTLTVEDRKSCAFEGMHAPPPGSPRMASFESQALQRQ